MKQGNILQPTENEAFLKDVTEPSTSYIQHLTSSMQETKIVFCGVKIPRQSLTLWINAAVAAAL